MLCAIHPKSLVLKQNSNIMYVAQGKQGGKRVKWLKQRRIIIRPDGFLQNPGRHNKLFRIHVYDSIGGYFSLVAIISGWNGYKRTHTLLYKCVCMLAHTHTQVCIRNHVCKIRYTYIYIDAEMKVFCSAIFHLTR